MEDLTPEELEAILGSDYETLIADALRRRDEAVSTDPSPNRQAGVTASGRHYFDPGFAIEKYVNRYRNDKREQAASADLDKALADQKAGRRTYAEALTRKPPAPAMGAPRTADSTIPGAPPPQAPPAVPPAPPVPPQAPPAPGATPPATAQGLGPMPTGEPRRGPGPALGAPAAPAAPDAIPGGMPNLPPGILQELLAQLRGR